MRVIFGFVFSAFIISSCGIDDGVQRNYIISKSQEEEIPKELWENNEDQEILPLTD